MTSPAPLPGGVGVSHVRVYDAPGPDGLRGGSPHLHTVCSEAYLVIAGEGAVQTLSGDGYRETPLVTGTVAWFTAGTVHRLINLDGRLELFVLMSNAGLPEAGDLVLAFEPDLLADPHAYRSAARLPPDGSTTDGSDDAAMHRRDLAVRGFTHWRNAVERDGVSARAPLYDAATRLIGDAARSWPDVLAAAPTTELQRSHARLDHLLEANPAHAVNDLAASAIESRSLLPSTRRYGCCGTLGTLVDAINP